MPRPVPQPSPHPAPSPPSQPPRTAAGKRRLLRWICALLLLPWAVAQAQPSTSWDASFSIASRSTEESGQALFSPSTPASAADPSPTPPPRPRIGLVLSGGGARGIAHVGVLQALEEARVPVDVVVGTSMGAIVGGLYASGMSAQALRHELSHIAWDTLFDRRAPRPHLPHRHKEQDFELSPVVELGFREGSFRVPTGAVSTRSLEWLLRRLTLPVRDIHHFDALPTPFRAVATDMETGEPMVLDHGDLATALRASMSVPGLFSPTPWGPHILGDGGLVNNLPVDVARSLGADVIIAVNIGTPLAGREQLNSVLGISEQMINILTEQNVRRSIALLTPADLLLTPPLGRLSSADFGRAAEFLDIGLRYGRSVAASLQRLALPAEAYAQWQLARSPRAAPLPSALAFVEFEGISPAQAAHLSRQVRTQAHQPLDPPTLQADLLQLSASGDYEHVDARLEPDEPTASEGLVFSLQPNSWGPNYLRAGLDLRTDFAGNAGFNLRFSHARRWLTDAGTEWRSLLEIGENTALRTELLHPWSNSQDRHWRLHLQGRRERVELYAPAGDPLATYERRTRTVGIDHGWSLGRGERLGSLLLGLLARQRSLHAPLVSPSAASLGYSSLLPQNPGERWWERGMRLRLITDQLDQPNFARQGHRLLLTAERGHRHSGLGVQPYSRLETSLHAVHSWGAHTLGGYARLARASAIPAGALDEYSLGGFGQLSGFKPGQVAGNDLALLRLDLRRRLDVSPGVARGYHIGGSLEWGNAWTSSNPLRWRGLKRGSSLYIAADTGLGPAYFAAVKGQGQPTGLYLFVGRP